MRLQTAIERGMAVRLYPDELTSRDRAQERYYRAGIAANGALGRLWQSWIAYEHNWWQSIDPRWIGSSDERRDPDRYDRRAIRRMVHLRHPIPDGRRRRDQCGYICRGTPCPRLLTFFTGRIQPREMLNNATDCMPCVDCNHRHYNVVGRDFEYCLECACDHRPATITANMPDMPWHPVSSVADTANMPEVLAFNELSRRLYPSSRSY